MELTVSVALPVLEIVSVLVGVWPTATLPNAKSPLNEMVFVAATRPESGELNPLVPSALLAFTQ